MIELHKLEQHLSELSQDDWQRLFDFIPKIEVTEEFAEYNVITKNEKGEHILPYVANSDLVSDFILTAYELILPNFDWPQWKTGMQLINNKSTDYNSISLVDLCKLLTVIIRSDRYFDGNLAACFENGTILKILKAMRAKVENS